MNISVIVADGVDGWAEGGDRDDGIDGFTAPT